VNWPQTGFSLGSAVPRQPLKARMTNWALQAGATSTEKPIEISQKLKSEAGDWGALSVPELVSMQEGQSTRQSFDVGLEITNRKLEVCKFEIVDDGIDGSGSLFAITLGGADSQKIFLTTQGVAPKLYKIKLRVYLDNIQDRCNGVTGYAGLFDGWEETPEIVINVAVTTASKKFNQEKEVLEFTGDFNVSNTVDFQFDPSLIMDIRMGSNSLIRPDSARIGLDATTNITQTLVITATGAATLNKQSLPLIKPRDFIKVFMAGPVPVVVEGTFWMDVEVSGRTTGAINATEKLELGYKKLSYTLTYDGAAVPADQWRATGEAQPTYDLTIHGDGNATATVQVALVPQMKIRVLRMPNAHLTLRPYLDADAGLKGKVFFNQNPNGLTADADAWLTKAELRGGVDAYLYASLVPFKANILSYPSGADPEKYTDHRLVTLVPLTTIATLPALTAQQALNDTHPADSRAILIRVTATDIQNPFRNFPVPFGPESFLPFRDWQTPKVVALNNTGYHWIAPPSGTGENTTGLVHSKDYWLVIEKPGTYTVRLGGNSVMGGWARQVAPDVVLNYTDANNDGIPDPWAAKFGSNNLQVWQVGGDPATTSGTPNSPPVASFGNTVNGQTVSFDASTSTDGDGSIASYDWIFGDGGTASGRIASRSYARSGTYSVKLIVTDNKGATASISQNVTVGGTTTATVAPTISSIDPNPVTGSNTRQLFTIYGKDFVNKPTVTLTWTGQPNYTVPAAQVTYLSSTQLQMSVTTTTTPDNWTVRVTNPDGKFSNIASFAVVAPTSTTAQPTAFTLSTGSPYCTGGTPAVQVSWTGSSGVTTYDVYRNGNLYSPGVPSYTTTFSNTANLLAGQSYSYYVVAKNASGSTQSNTVTVTIPSNVCQTTAPTTYSMTPAAASVNENAGTVTFTVTRSGGLPSESVYVSTTATEGFANSSDYTGIANQALAFAANQTSATVTVALTNDSVTEPNETFGLIVQRNATDAVTTYLAKSTFTIVNDDVAATPAISSLSSYSFNGACSAQPLIIYGSNFVSGATVNLYDLTHNQSYPNRATTFNSSGQLTLSATYGGSAANWSLTVVNPNGSSSLPVNFSIIGPSITGVSPNPVPRSNSTQTITFYGSGFLSGAAVQIDDGTGPYAKTPTVLSSGQITISANLTSATATWRASIRNCPSLGDTWSPWFNF
jgi:hypothetical protein